MKTVLILIIVIIIGIFVWNKSLLNFPQINAPQKQAGISTKIIKEENTVKRYVIDSEYPEITGLIDAPTQTLINNKIKDVVNKVIDDFILNLPTENQLTALPKDLKFHI